MKKVLLLVLIFSRIIISQINTESFRKDYDSLGISGNLGLDFVSLTGNTELQLFSVNGRMNYNFGKSYSFFVFNSELGWKDNQRFSNLSLLHLRYVHEISTLFQIETFVQYNYDKSRLLLNRELIGGGTRIKFLTEQNIKLRIGISGMIEIEEYDLPENSVHPKQVNDFRLSSYLSINIKISDFADFISTSYYQPLPDDFEDVKILSENAIQSKLTDSFKVAIKFNARFDSKPPDGRKKLDTSTKVGISYEF